MTGIDYTPLLRGQPIEFPEKYQLESLGLDREALKRLKERKTKVLDIGGGRQARLAYMFNQKGIPTDCIDPLITGQKPFLISQEVTDVYPNPGCIPRQDNCYDLVLAHAVNPLDKALTTFADAQLRFESAFGASLGAPEKMRQTARAIILEGLRVMKRDGRFIIKPGLNRLGNLGEELSSREYKISYSQIKRTEGRDEEYQLLRSSTLRLGLPPNFFDFMLQRTVITWKGK